MKGKKETIDHGAMCRFCVKSVLVHSGGQDLAP